MESGVPREQLFTTRRSKTVGLTSKAPSIRACSFCIYLLHNPFIIPTAHELQAAWEGLENVKASGEASSIGISNMQRDHVKTILQTATVTSATNQLEYHPYLQWAHDYIPWLREQGIVESSSKGLAPITVGKGEPLDDVVSKAAASHGVAPGVILLR